MSQADNIGVNILKLRNLRGWSQETMAARMQCHGGDAYNMTRQMIGNIETGRTNASTWQISALRDVLNCTYDEIFRGPDMSRYNDAALHKKPRKRRRGRS